jgi:hypothetical protein
VNAKQVREVLLWLGVFSITAIFQFWRASELDGLIFIIVIALIAITAVSEREFKTYINNRTFAKWAKIYLLLSLTVLAFSRIHTLPSLVAMLALVPLLLISREKEDHPAHPRKAITRATAAWSCVAVAMAIWELLSYIAGAITGADYRTPTISMLVDPFIHHSAGRIVFTVIWGFIGYELLFHRKVK